MIFTLNIMKGGFDYIHWFRRTIQKNIPLNHIGALDEYSVEFTAFDVFGNEVRIYDERLCEAIKKLSERRRNVVLMFYFLELPDAEIAEILDISRNSVYRNRMCSLKLIRDMYEEEL